MTAPSFPTNVLPIVVAHDLGPGGRRAADLGAAIAHALGVPLHLVHVMDAAEDADLGALPAGIAPAVEILRARIAQRTADERASLQAEVERLMGKGLDHVSSEHVEGRASEAIVAIAARDRAQLVVVAAHAGSPTSRAPSSGAVRLLGSTAERIVRHANVPVAVAPDEPVVTNFWAGASWVVGTDLGPTSRPPLETARRLAALAGGRVLVVHATGAAPATYPALLEELRRCVGADATVEPIVTAGPAAAAFLRITAAQSAGALLLGVHEHRGLLARALGRDALGPTFRSSRVPVLCVPA